VLSMTLNRTSQSSNPQPEWLTVDPKHGKPLFGNRLTPTEESIAERWQLCHVIARHAYHIGLDTDPFKVNRKFREWKLWYAGGLATGYLIRMTGTKYRPGH
jgi:hypothetical protein